LESVTHAELWRGIARRSARPVKASSSFQTDPLLVGTRLQPRSSSFPSGIPYRGLYRIVWQPWADRASDSQAFFSSSSSPCSTSSNAWIRFCTLSYNRLVSAPPPPPDELPSLFLSALPFRAGGRPTREAVEGEVVAVVGPEPFCLTKEGLRLGEVDGWGVVES
jgi:hypothetical protein